MYPRCIKQFKGCLITHISSFPQLPGQSHPPKEPQQCLFGPQASSQTQCIVHHVVRGKTTDYIHHFSPPPSLVLCGVRGTKNTLQKLNSFHVSKRKLQLYQQALIFFFLFFNLTVKSAKAVFSSEEGYRQLHFLNSENTQ